MRTIIAYLTALMALSLAWAPAVTQAAVNCTISGYMNVEPLDRFYCDTSQQVCSGWLQQDLHTKRVANGTALPMRFMQLTFWNGSGVRLATTYTNASGWFSVVVNLPGSTCVGNNVGVQREFARIHESDLASSSPRYRFRIVNNTSARNTQLHFRSVPLTGSTTDASYTQMATSTTSEMRWSNVYHTVDSALSEIVNWNSTLSTRLSYPNLVAAQAWVVDPTFTSSSYAESASGQTGTIFLNWSSYAAGGEIRHELGHWVQAALHSFGQHHTCLDYSYNSHASHGFDSCEYGYTSNKEALATFIAVRSITSADTNAWYCQFNATFAQARCTLDINSLAGGADQDGINPFTLLAILGDLYATSATRCAVSTEGCGCTGTGCTDQTFRNNNGFRNEIQPARLYWDVLDTNNEGTDDVDLTMGNFVTAIMGMASGTSPGQYNEANQTTCQRDQTNVKDYADRIDAYIPTIIPTSPPNTASERTLNCVSSGVP